MNSCKVTRHFTDGEFGQLHYRIAGEASAKPAIVCLHMVSKSSRSFQHILPILGQDRLAIAIDYPGYGESSLPFSESQANIENYATAVWQVLTHLSVTKVDFVGYHTGCMVSVCAAHQQPQWVNKVVNIAAPIFLPSEVQTFCDKFAPIPLDEQGNRFRIMWERIIHYRGPGMTLEMCADSMAENLRAGDAYEWGHMAAFNHAAQYIEQIKTLSHRLLVINLDDDMREQSERVDSYLNNGLRKDYFQWAAGFLDAFPEDVAVELLSFFDA
ncbi:alpha/beta fold hydrolase [Paraglaciecola arctica]|uniref:alpha/beta fold hydrolase n=1 Tax=Paraglaciecola arctica TaxID=1128911 RepID=UPI001C06665E|nr:alpha/beta hydrolase [Paraglaciecola arctica]MBU3002617.1 alpha/beta hydrolase [Paraglaciecola arctica]